MLVLGLYLLLYLKLLTCQHSEQNYQNGRKNYSFSLYVSGYCFMIYCLPNLPIGSQDRRAKKVCPNL